MKKEERDISHGKDLGKETLNSIWPGAHGLSSQDKLKSGKFPLGLRVNKHRVSDNGCSPPILYYLSTCMLAIKVIQL